MNALRTLFRRLGRTACPLQADVAGGLAEHHEGRPYWLLAQAGIPRY